MNGNISTCQHYHFAHKLKLMEGMGPAQGHRLEKSRAWNLNLGLQLHRILTSCRWRGLTQTCPTQTQVQLISPLLKVSTWKLARDLLRTCQVTNAHNTAQQRRCRWAAGGQRVGWRARQESGTAHSTHACSHDYVSPLLSILIIFTQVFFRPHWPLIGQLFIEHAYNMPGTLLGTQQWTGQSSCPPGAHSLIKEKY